MPDYRLSHAVVDFEGRQLLAAGTPLSRSVFDSLIGLSQAARRPCPLMTYRRVRPDLLGFLGGAPYDVVVGSGGRRKRLLETAAEVRMPEVVLASLYHFRDLDFYTYRHILLVFALAIVIARELIAEKEALLQEITAGPTHDIGKLCLPPAILSKEASLTRAEHTYLKHHALAGYVLLSYYFQDPGVLAAQVARDHHERRDGSGYPLGIAVDDPMTDIIMVGDIYDALISPRPYRPVSYDNRTALEEITRQAEAGIISGTVARVLVALNRRSRPHYSRCVVSAERRGSAPLENRYGTTDSGPDEPGD
jgi:hypothetical protein